MRCGGTNGSPQQHSKVLPERGHGLRLPLTFGFGRKPDVSLCRVIAADDFLSAAALQRVNYTHTYPSNECSGVGTFFSARPCAMGRQCVWDNEMHIYWVSQWHAWICMLKNTEPLQTFALLECCSLCPLAKMISHLIGACFNWADAVVFRLIWSVGNHRQTFLEVPSTANRQPFVLT